MIEVALAGWVVLIGGLVILPVAAEHRLRGAWMAGAVPAGYAVYVIAALVLAVVDWFSPLRALSLASVLAVSVAAAWIADGERRSNLPWRKVLFQLGVLLAVAAAVAAVTQVVHFTRLTPDSMAYLSAAGGVERTGGLDGLTPSTVLKRLLVIPALQASGALTGRGYVASVIPLIWLAGMALTGWVSVMALRAVDTPRRWMVLILAAGGAFLLTTNRVVFNLAYVHTHMVFATFLLLGVGMAWLAARHRCWSLLLPAALGFAALPMLRAEAVLVVTIFLLPFVTETEVPLRGRWFVTGAFSLTTFLWFAVAVPPHVGSADLGLTGPVLGSLAGPLAVAAVLAATQVPKLRRLAALAPAAVLVLLTLYIGAKTLGQPSVFEESVAATASNLAVAGRWGTFWAVTIPLVVVAILALELPLQRLFAYPIVTFWVAIIAFTYLREGGYRAATGDSGNRMMMHITLVTMIYLMMAAGRAASLDAATGERPTETVSPT